MSVSPENGAGDLRFSPTSGVLAGWVGVALCAGAAVMILTTERTLQGVRYAVVACLFGLLVWCFMLRPRVVIGSSTVELRNALSSWHVPLVNVRKVVVRAITRVYTDERRYEGVAVGRPMRAMMRKPAPSSRARVTDFGSADLGPTEPAGVKEPHGRLDANGVADFVTEQILFAADNAREAGHESERAKRTWALPELIGLVALVIVLVVTFVL